MKKILDKSNMTAEDWQKYREKQKGIGGSDVATILGLNPYKTPFTLWLEKTNQVEPPKVENRYVEWGNILEPVIRDKFAEVTGFEVFENPYVLQHDICEFMVANIDGEIIDDSGEKGILEIKTANERMKNEWDDRVPHHYMLQIQHYLAVMGEEYQFAYCAVLIGGNDFRYFKIERDDYVIDKIITAEAEFVKMIEQRIPPEISGKEPDSNYLSQAYPETNNEESELSKELFGLTLRYTELQAQIKSLQEEADYIKNRIKLEAKEYKVLKNDLIKISMPTIKKVSFDSKRFKEDHPDLYEQYKTKESSYRSFSVSHIK